MRRSLYIAGMGREPTIRDYAIARDASTVLYGLGTLVMFASEFIWLANGQNYWLSRSSGPVTLIASLFLFAQAAKLQKRAKLLRPEGYQEGTSLLRVGVTIGTILLIFCALSFPAGGGGKDQARKTACLSSAKQLGMAALIYSEDHDDGLPPASPWMDAIQPHLKDPWLLVCTADSMDAGDRSLATPQEYGRAMNRYLSGKKLSHILAPQEQHLFYDSDAEGRNQSEFMPKFPAWRHHDGSYVVVYAGGHAGARGAQPKERR